MKKISLSMMLVSFGLAANAQQFELPVGYKLEKAEDYRRYEREVIQAIDWIIGTPLGQMDGNRKEVNAFLLQWMSGSPIVHLEIKQEIVTFIDSPDLLMIFMGGWTKYSLESKDFHNKVEGSLAGVEAVITFYEKNRQSLKRDKAVEKYIKLKQSGKLKSYIVENA
jgi:hypothetical protein